MKGFWAQLIVGILSGIITPILALWAIFEFRPELLAVQSFDKDVIKVVNVQLITLGILLNAGIFFGMMRFDREDMARGVLISTVTWLIAIFIYRFLL